MEARAVAIKNARDTHTDTDTHTDWTGVEWSGLEWAGLAGHGARDGFEIISALECNHDSTVRKAHQCMGHGSVADTARAWRELVSQAGMLCGAPLKPCNTHYHIHVCV